DRTPERIADTLLVRTPDRSRTLFHIRGTLVKFPPRSRARPNTFALHMIPRQARIRDEKNSSHHDRHGSCLQQDTSSIVQGSKPGSALEQAGRNFGSCPPLIGP